MFFRRFLNHSLFSFFFFLLTHLTFLSFFIFFLSFHFSFSFYRNFFFLLYFIFYSVFFSFRLYFDSFFVIFFLPSLKQNFIAYHSFKVSSRPDCIFEIHQLWQSGFSRVYSNSCSSCSFEPEIMKIGQSSQKMYSNNIVNFQESTSILNASTKTVWKLIEGTMYIRRTDKKLIGVIIRQGKASLWLSGFKKFNYIFFLLLVALSFFY